MRLGLGVLGLNQILVLDKDEEFESGLLRFAESS